MDIDEYIKSQKKVIEETFEERGGLPALFIQIYLQMQILETLGNSTGLILDSLDKRYR